MLNTLKMGDRLLYQRTLLVIGSYICSWQLSAQKGSPPKEIVNITSRATGFGY